MPFHSNTGAHLDPSQGRRYRSFGCLLSHWKYVGSVRVCFDPPPPPKNVTFFYSKLLLDNSARFTSSTMKDLCQKMESKTIFCRGAWNSLMAWPDWSWPPLFNERSTSPIHLVTLVNGQISLWLCAEFANVFLPPPRKLCFRQRLSVCLLRDRRWLPVKQRVEYKLCTTVHRCLYGEAASYLVDLITPSAAVSAIAGLRSAELTTVAVPRTLSSLGDRSLATAGPRAWNKLPPHLRLMQSADTFSFRRYLNKC